MRGDGGAGREIPVSGGQGTVLQCLSVQHGTTMSVCQSAAHLGAASATLLLILFAKPKREFSH